MGTALTEAQVDEIRRLTTKMTMALDQDSAGQNATLRSLDVVLQSYLTKTVNQATTTALGNPKTLTQGNHNATWSRS
ncbi:MAG: hypothetical protein Ct9H300mP11_24430 [Chloroflexota bacterium]|nr:MAG: hypothetical protein Ct9H300mP11_24430 [Chloroflexota bacterium]